MRSGIDSQPVDDARTVVTTELVVELGETNLWATVDDQGVVSRPELIKGMEPGRFPAVLRVTEAGRWFWGAGRRLRDGDLLVSNVLARVDDPVPVFIGREGFEAAELVARQVATLFRLAKPSAPARLKLVHPVDLSRRGREAVERHLARRLPPGTFVDWTSRAAAAVAATPECADLVTGDRVGVLHVGGVSVEAAVWRQTGPSAGEVGVARVDRGGAGHAVDDVLLGALTQGTGFGRSAGRSNVDVPALHRECERAKTALSAETAVDVDVEGVPVRMVRGDVEDLSAPLVMRQLDTLGAAIARSDQEGSPLRMILLLGGATAAPSLVEAASVRFEVPVIAAPRVGEAFARRTTTRATKISDGGSTLESATPPRGAAPAPLPTADDESPAAVLARARRRWAPMVPLTAATAVASTSSGPRAIAPASTPRSTARSTAAPGPAASPLPAAFVRPGARLARVPVPRPTHLAMAAAVLIAVAAVPAIGGAMQDADDQTTAAAPSSGSAAVAGAASGLFGGGGLAFTPGAAGQGGPSATQWLANPTGTLGPNQLLSMVRPAANGGSGSMPSTAAGLPAAVAAGAVPAGGATPAGGSAPVGGAPGTGATPPAGSGSTPASTTPPANPPASDPPAASDPLTASDPPAASDPPPASDPPADPPPASDPPPPADPSPEPTPDPVPTNVEPVADPTPAADDSGGDGGAADVADDVVDGADGSIVP
jgi:hypothetical protein